MAKIAVFCGARDDVHARFFSAAKQLGNRLAQKNHSLIYGGSTTGLMGAIADATLDHGGCVIGICPTDLAAIEPTHPQLTEKRMVRDIAEHKHLMTKLADAYIAIPGGFGTMDELFHVWTQIRTSNSPDDPAKAIGLLNTGGFYDPLVQFLTTPVIHHRFAGENALDNCLINPDPATLLQQIEIARASTLANIKPLP